MITVLIVDDEFLVRESIKKSVDWTNLGFEMIGEAKDGLQAREMIDRYEPDILIVDINLPFMNGIELAAYVQEQYPMTKTIIVTGYSEFEFAQKAIRAGVQGYLTKPIETKEIVEGLIRAQKTIAEEKNTKIFVEALQRQQWFMERQRFLSRMVSGEEEASSLKAQLDKFGLPHDLLSFCSVAFAIEDRDSTDPYGKDRELWEFAVSNIIEEAFGAYLHPVVFPSSDQQITVLLHCEERMDLAEIKRICEKIIAVVKQHLRFSISSGIGQVCESYSRLHLSYREADHAVKQRFAAGHDRVFVYDSQIFDNDKLILFNDEDKRNLLIALRLGKINEIHPVIDGIFREMERLKYRKEHSVFLAMNISSIAIEFIKENGFFPKEIIQRDLLELFMEMKTVEDVRLFVNQLYQKSIELVFGKRNRGISKTVEKAKCYIEKQVCKVDLSLEEIASQIFVNSSYLSSIFKQEMGVSVVEYINICRLNRSKEILDQDDFVNIETLAYDVGYSDHYYFSKRFKRQFGLTPKKYLENKKID